MTNINQTTALPEYRKVTIASVTCAKCRLPHSVNEDHLCSFCSRRVDMPSRIEQRTGERQELLMMIAAIAFVAIVTWLLTRWA